MIKISHSLILQKHLTITEPHCLSVTLPNTKFNLVCFLVNKLDPIYTKIDTKTVKKS